MQTELRVESLTQGSGSTSYIFAMAALYKLLRIKLLCRLGMETGFYTSITILAVYLPLPASPMLVGVASLLPPHPGDRLPTHFVTQGRRRCAGPPALRLADSKPGRPGLSEISAGTGLRPG